MIVEPPPHTRKLSLLKSVVGAKSSYNNKIAEDSFSDWDET
jgi:hypothetical protein